MKPMEFVKEHKVEIGVGIVAVAAATVGYKLGYSRGVDHVVNWFNVLKTFAKETGEAVPTVIRGLKDSNIEIPVKIFPEIIEDFEKCTGLAQLY